jgi:O-antigen/teichoic acid export membrane protein
MAQRVTALPASAAPVAGGGLRRLAVRGSIIELGGYAANQVLRLATNLVLSRLLFPAAYGLTAIVTVFLIGLGMLSDVGLRDSVIRHERGDDPHFLNTAWSLQIVRGFMLWGATIAIAFPVSALYGEPQLMPLLFACSFSMLMHGFNSTSVFTLSRQVRRGPIVVLEVVSKAISMLVMFVWAWVHPSVWALVAGGLAADAATVLGSHFLPVHYRNKPEWEREAARELTGFGKWVFGSSAFSFAAGEGDRLLLGYLLTMPVMGVYSIAQLLSSSVSAINQRLVYSVVYGILGQVARDNRPRLQSSFYAARMRLDLLIMPILGALMVLGPKMIGFLYDDRYQAAGWMLQILCVRVAISNVHMPCGVCLMALGKPRVLMVGNMLRFITI